MTQMKRLVPIMILLVICFAPVCAHAETVPNPGDMPPAAAVADAQSGALDIEKIQDSLPPDSRRMLRDIDPQSPALESGVGAVFSGIDASGATKSVLALGLKILAMLFMCSICNEFSQRNRQVITIACVLFVTVLLLSDVHSIMALAQKVINQMLTLSKTLFPTLAAVAAAAGKPMESTAKYTVTVFGIDLLMQVISAVLVPLIYVYIALLVADCITGNSLFAKLSELVSAFVSSSLKLIVTLFLAYISISSAVAAGGDSLARRTARFVVSSGVPVIGSALSDGSETILASANLIKNSLGIYGLLCILAIIATPLVIMAVRYVAFKILSGLSGTVAEAGVVKLLDGFSKAYGLMVGLCVAVSVMLLISITQIILMVGA